MENASPHSYRTRAEQIKRHNLQPNKITGSYRKPITPTEPEAAILRRIARGHLMVTQAEDDKGRKVTVYSYEDGTRVSHIGKQGFNFDRFVDNGWIVPIEGEAMFEGPPQRYVVPKR